MTYAYLNARFGLDGSDSPAADAVDDALLRAADGMDEGIDADYICVRVHMLRSRKGPVGWSWAARPVLLTSAVVVVLSLALPWTTLGAMLGLRPLPVAFLLWLVPILGTYGLALLAGKRVYQRALGVWL